MNAIVDKNAEQSVLGALILEESIAYKVRELKEDLFYYNSHKYIFRAMKNLVDKNQPIDIILLKSELEKLGVFEDIGLTYLTSITSIVQVATNIDYYIKILREKNMLRELTEQTKSLIAAIENNADLSELAVDIEELKNITVSNSSIQNNYADASSIDVDYEKEHRNISTGFAKLDKTIDGFRHGTLTILSGKPSSGKSTIINQFIAAAIDKGEKRFLYSGELPTATVMEWFRRTVASERDLKKYQTAYGAKFTAPSEKAVELMKKWLRNKLYIYREDATADQQEMIRCIEHLWLKKGVRMFVLDNLMTLDIDSNKDKYEAQKNFVKNLKNLAKKYKLVIILVAHPKKTNTETFDMFDVAGASEIVNLCDYELAMHRKIDEERGTDETFLIVLKNRATGKQNLSLKLAFDDERKRLYSIPDELNREYGYDIRIQESFGDIAPF